MAHISDIKLIRTDTTLDLSQKAEKGMNFYALKRAFYKNTSDDCYLYSSIRDLIRLAEVEEEWSELAKGIMLTWVDESLVFQRGI
ncbi:hypothetical protein AAZX31_20G091500 [Glycine max]